MKKLFYILFAMTMAACGSQGDEPVTPVTPVTPDTPEQAQCAMSFTPYSEAESRDDASDAVAAALGNKFAVFATKTNAAGATEYVLSKDTSGSNPYIVSYTPAQGWDYADPADQYLRYWDLSAQEYIFYAIANYPPTGAGSFSTKFSDGKATISGINTTDPAAANIMESHYRRDGLILNDFDLLGEATLAHYIPTSKGTTPAYADIVPLPFHYLLSQVQFKIYNRAPQYGPSIPISHVTIHIYDAEGYYTVGDYTNPGFNNMGEPSHEFVDKDLTDTFILSSKNKAITLYSGIVLPQELEIKARVTITTDNGIISGTVILTPGWERGKIYTYYLYTEYTEDYILVDTVEIDDWIPGATVSNTQTNW